MNICPNITSGIDYIDNFCFESGIKKAFITEYSNVVDYTVDGTSKKVTAINMVVASPSPVFYEYGFKEFTGNFTTSTTKNENNAVICTQNATIVLHENFQDRFNVLDSLIKNRLVFIIQDNNDRFQLFGEKYGTNVTNIETVSGTAMGDLSGQTLTFTATESSNPRELNNATVITSLL